MKIYQVIIIAFLAMQAGMYLGRGERQPLQGSLMLLAALFAGLTFMS